MTVTDAVTLSYLIIGVGLAAVVYHAVNGGWDDKLENRCSCGKVHESSEADLEARHTLEMLRTVRSTPRGAWALALATALACVMTVFAWPAVGGWLIWRVHKNRASRG